MSPRYDNDDYYDDNISSRRHRIPFKLYFILLGLVIAYIVYQETVLYLLDYLRSHPSAYSTFIYIKNLIANYTLEGLFIMAVLGSLFFMALPSEVLFLYYISSTNNPVFVVFVVVLLGSFIGVCFNYFFGSIFGQRLVRWMFGSNYDKYENSINNSGGFILFFGNIIPSPIELVSVVYGAFRYPFASYVTISMIGKVIKYLILLAVFLLFWDQILYHYDNFIDSIALLRELY